MVSPSRRGFLASLAMPFVVAGPAPVSGQDARTVDQRSTGVFGGSRQSETPFRPSVDGFGFPNWSTAVATFPEHDHQAVSEEQVRRTIRREWQGPLARSLDQDFGHLPTRLVDLIAKQLYVSVNQRSGTNGHCYGMTFTAQEYYDEPDGIPLEKTAASEFANPAEPLDQSDAPVGQEIDLFQNSQFLDFFAWVGRRVMVNPSWIDYDTQIRNLVAVLDEYGTAGITLINTTTRASHQVLVYGYDRSPERFTLSVYEPNRPADGYGLGRDPGIEVDLRGDQPVVQPYGPGYDAFVYNRYDRIISARRAAEPLDAVETSDAELRDHLFNVAIFLVDSADVRLTVIGPKGRPILRDVSTFMDRSQTGNHWMRYRYGAAPGKYRVVVTGVNETDYTLEASAADREGTLLHSRHSESIGAGAVHNYVATIGESPTQGGSLERISDATALIGTGVGLGVGAAGLAAGGYALYRYRTGCSKTRD